MAKGDAAREAERRAAERAAWEAGERQRKADDAARLKADQDRRAREQAAAEAARRKNQK